MIVIRRRLEIVVMPMSSGPRQVGELPLVLEAVRAVMIGRQVEPYRHCHGTRSQPSPQDGDHEQSLQRYRHAIESVRYPAEGSREAANRSPRPSEVGKKVGISPLHPGETPGLLARYLGI